MLPNGINPANDHDLLIIIARGQEEMRQDVRSMADQLKEMKTTLDQTRDKQRDQDERLANTSNTLMRLQADQREDHTGLGRLQDEHTRWKLYMRIVLLLLSPVYLIFLALLIEAGKRYLFP